MEFRTILGLSISLIVCFCLQQELKGALQMENGPNQHLGSKSGLLIENGHYRGTEYTDSLGTNYYLKYAPITIANDSTSSIHLQIAFSDEYDSPIACGDGQFRVIPMPWIPDEVKNWESMIESYIDQPLLNKILEPGEKFTISIGTLYTRPPNFCGVLPITLFAHCDKEIFPKCDWLMKEDPSSDPQIALGLRLKFGGSCTIIPCGQIFFSDPKR